jgi:hypothetical protein
MSTNERDTKVKKRSGHGCTHLNCEWTTTLPERTYQQVYQVESMTRNGILRQLLLASYSSPTFIDNPVER